MMSHQDAHEWHRIAEERRQQLERLREDGRFRAAARALSVGRRVRRMLGTAVARPRGWAIRTCLSLLALPRRVTARARERRLRALVAALPMPAPSAPSTPDLVTAVIVTAAQPERLGRLLDQLARTGIRVLVVDNAGAGPIADIVGRHPHAEHVRVDGPIPFAAANELVIERITTPWILFLNDDVLPLEDSWLERMLAAADEATVAVGALLVHGPRRWTSGRGVDLTVQHAGIAFELRGPLPVPVHLGRGSAPSPSVEHPEVTAATAACLLVRTAAHRAVGGFHLGFDYGMEDVDLCLRLAAHGRIRVALDAVLLHEEGATRLAGASVDDRARRAARQHRNRTLLMARHGPRLRRELSTGGLAPGAPLRAAVVGPRHGLPIISGWGLAPGRSSRVGLRRSGGAGAELVVVTGPSRSVRTLRPSPVPVVAWGERAVRALRDGSWRGPSPDLIVLPDATMLPAGSAERLMIPVRTLAGGDAGHLDAEIDRLMKAPRWSIRIGAPSGRRGMRWGDVPVAEALCAELRNLGIVARSTPRDRWGEDFDATADVTVQLKGRGAAPTADGQCNVIWVMSHPSEVAPGELEAADLVVAASSLLAERYRASSGRPVAVLPQAADTRRFGPGAIRPELSTRVLFIGNTRSVPRDVVLGAVEAGLPLTLIGDGWERFLDPGRVLRRSVPHEELGDWYRSAEVVLNDHWEEMRRWGIISNRVFEALACGACVVSDEVPGMGALLGDAVVTVQDREEVGPVVRALLDDPQGRASRAERGQRAVLADHSWEHRAIELVRLVSDVARAPVGPG